MKVDKDLMAMILLTAFWLGVGAIAFIMILQECQLVK